MPTHFSARSRALRFARSAVLSAVVGLLLPGMAWASVDWVVNNSDTGYDPIPAGGDIVYSVRVGNNGTDPAPATTLTLSIPATTSFVSASGMTCSGAGPVTCNVPALSVAGVAGDNATVLVRVRTSAQGTVVLGASVPVTGDADSSNNVANQSTTVNAGADIELTLAGPASAQSGSVASYTFSARNIGPNPAGNLTLTFPAPAGLYNISAPGCTISSPNACTIAGPLAVGATVTRTFSGQIAVAAGSTITPSGSVASTAPLDPVAGNNTAVFNTSVTAGSDVRISKSRAPGGNLLVGQAASFTLDPRYTGDVPSGLTITDVVPDNYTVGAVLPSQNGWACSVAGQTVTCTRAAGSVAGNNVALGNIVIPVTAASPGSPNPVINSASIAATSPTDPNPANNSASDGGATILAPTVDLRAHKSGPSPALVVVGSSYVYNISASNIGTAAFHGTLVMTDDLPAGLRVDSYSLNGWACLPAAPVTGPATITCNRSYTAGAPLGVGATSPAVVLNTTATGTGSINNRMTVSSPDANIADTNSANDVETYAVTSSAPANAADLSVLKSVSPTTVAAGEVLTYTLEIVNAGPQTATTVALSDSLTGLMNSSVAPTGAGYVGQTISAGVSTGGSCSTTASGATGRDLSCNFTSIPVCTVGSNCPVITVQVRPGGNGGSRSNWVYVNSHDTADPDSIDRVASVSSMVDPRADVTVTKTATPVNVPAGQNLTYVVTAINLNNGLSQAAAVTITDTLPSNVTFISVAPSSGSCSAPAANSTTGPGNNQVVCNFGTIANNAQRTATIVVRPNTATRNTTLTNSVVVSTSTAETNTGNNSATVSTPVTPPALDLLINKTDSVDPVAAGDNTVYTITVTNQGPSAAENVVITDTLPPTRLSFQSHTVPSGGSCSSVPAVDNIGGTLVCQIPYLAASQISSLTITMQGVAKGVSTNSASVSSDEVAAGFDSNPANNSVTETTTVRTKADMQVVSKTPSAATVNLRDDFSFVIRVRNNTGAGLAEADDVVLTDNLPAHMVLTGAPTVAIVSGSASTTTCTGAAGSTSFTCALGTVSNGAEIDITVPVQLIAVTSYPQVFINTASVATSSLDTVPANNSNSGSVTVNSSSLAGRVFRDFNNNGLVDAGDTGINGVTLTLSGTTFDGVALNRSTTSNASGNFVFNFVPQGSYTITQGAVSETNLVDGIDSAGSAGGTVANDVISAIALPSNTAATGYLFAEVPQARIGIAKQLLASPSINADGSFNVNFRLFVRNLGLEALNNIAVTDPLAGPAPRFGTHATLANPATDPLLNGHYTLLAAPSGSCVGLNPGFNGAADTTVASGFALAAGATCEINLSLRVRGTTPLPPVLPSGGRYENQATVVGTGALSGQSFPTQPQLQDLSDNGSNPDPNGNGRANDANENDPTPVNPVFNSAIGIAKEISPGVSVQSDGSIVVPIRLLVRNVGNESLSNVAVTDPLASADGGQFGVFVSGGALVTLASGQYTLETAPAFVGLCTNGTLTAGFSGEVGGLEVARISGMEPAASCTMGFTYRFMPRAVTIYTNQARAAGTGIFSGASVTDLSDSGNNPDPNGNGNASEATENDPTPVPYPRVAIAKRVNTTHTANGDDTFTVPFQMVVRNTGGEVLNGVAVTDQLSGAKPSFGTFVTGGAAAVLAPGQYTVQTAPAFGGACAGGSANAAFNGDAVTLLANISGFAVDASCTVNVSIRFRPLPPLPVGGAYLNQAQASATGAQSSVVTNDLSDDGSNPDANNNGIGNETGENDPTRVLLSFTPRIGLAKAKPMAEIIHPNGSVSVPFRIRVQNFGTEPLLNVTVSDLVAGAAPAFGSFVAGGPAASLNNGEYTIEAAPTVQGACPVATLTPGFTGAPGNSQIASLSRLEVGAACEFDLSLRFRPQSPSPVGGYSNVATGAGTGEFTLLDVNDTSNNGTNPDSDSDGDPTNNNTPTPVGYTHTASIGIAKVLQSGLLVNGNGSYSGSFRMTVQNLGNEELNNVSVSDLMSGAVPRFGTHVAGGAGAVLVAGQYTIQSPPVFVGACATGTVNAGFDGSGAALAASIAQLPINGTCTLEFGFRFVPQPGQAYTNQATSTGTGAFSGSTAADSSDDGSNPDPNGNRNANEPGENDPTPVPIPHIGLAKSAAAVVNHGDGTYSVPFTLTVVNAGQTPLANVQITDAINGALPQFGTYTANAIPRPNEYTVVGAPVVGVQTHGATLTPVAAGVFTGSGAGSALLVPASSSLPNFGANPSSAQIQFTLRFFPTTAGPFNNTATGTGVSPAGGNVSDDSVNGANPDANGNGDPTDDASPTVVNLSAQVIGVAKAVTGVVQVGHKRYRVSYSIVVQNLSTSVTATNVQVTDDLLATFPTAQSRSISVAAAVSACTGTVLNVAPAAFTGSGQNRLLAGNQNLQPGERCSISFTAEIDFGTNPLPSAVQNNQALATTASTPAGPVIASDASDDGSNPDPNGNGNPGDAGENDPTPVSFAAGTLSAVSGTVYLDANHDRVNNDPLIRDRVQGFIVEVLNAAGTVLSTATTDASGNYSVAGLFPSTPGNPATYYSVRFREPASGAIYGIAQSADPTPTRNGVISNGVITALQLASGTTTLQQNLPLDPAGVVYNSVTRAPVAGAVVTLLAGGVQVADACLVGGVNAQTTGATGSYQYLLINPAPPGCPGNATYTLQVVQPGGYLPPPSNIIPPQAGPFTPPAGPPGSVFAMQPQPGAPTGADATTYYLSFALTLSGVGVVNNHIPIDPVLGGALALIKTTPLVNVSVGQLVPYTITARNTLAANLTHIDIRDTLPPGFKYVPGSATLDGVAAEPTVNGRVLTWSSLVFAPNVTRTVKLVLVVGAGVQPGEYVNTAQAFNNQVPPPHSNAVSNLSTAVVRVVPDPTFDCSDLIGKVFDDRNANGYQDEGEPGLPGVRLATARGWLVNTDAEGRFHVACAAIPDADRGSNFVMKLDERTLPTGYRVTTENPRDVRLTRGKLSKLNFGATIHKVVRVDMSDAAFEPGQTTLKPDWVRQFSALPEQFQARPSVLRLAYQAAGEGEGLARERLLAVRQQLQEAWARQGCCHGLLIEEELFLPAQPSRKVGE